MKLILITFPDSIPAEGKLLNVLFDSGLEKLHVRKPNYCILQMRRLLDSISPVYYDRIVLHDCFELVELYDIRQVHLNNRNPLPPARIALKLSCSYHSLQEITDISQYEYVFLSPIFNSISKEGYKSSFSQQELIKAGFERVINHKVIALGGICKENILFIRECGFGGVAVIGSIWGDYPENHEMSPVIARFVDLQKSCIL